MPSRQHLPSTLAKAQQELQNARIRIAELEVQLAESQPDSLDLTFRSEVSAERKLTEETLHRSEMRFRALVEAIEDYAICFLDTGGYVASWNIGAERLKGYQSVEIIGQHFSRFFTPEDQQRERPQQLLAIAEGAGHTEDEGWRVRKDGSRFWANVVITALRNTDGSLYGFAKITRDLTQHKRAEAAVERYARRMEILHQIDQGIINANSAEAILNAALPQIRRLISCQRATIGLLDMTQRAGVIFVVDSDDATTLGQGTRIPIEDDFFDGYDARHVRNIADFRIMQEFPPRFKQALNEGLCSGLNLLLMDCEQPIGILELFANTPGYFTAEHEEIMREVGNQLTVAIRQWRLSEKLAQHAATLEQKVTERTADLQAALERVEAILHNSPDAILLVASDLTIQQTNSSFNTLFSSARGEYLGQSLLTLLHPDDVSRIGGLAPVAVHQQNDRQVEVRAMRKDGTTLDAELNTGGIQDDGLVCIIRDITKRKEAEAELRKAEHRYRALFEQSHDAIFLFDMQGHILEVNHRAAEMLGYRIEELHALTYRDLSDDVPHSEALITQLLTGKVVPMYERIMRKKDGSRISVEISVEVVRDLDGNPLHMQSVVRDITERRRAEETLQRKMEEERQFQTNLKVLHEIVIELTRVDQLDTFYKRAVELGRERLGFERLAMFLYDERDDSAIGTYGTDTQGKLVDERSVRFTPDPHGVMQRSFERVERFYFKEETTLYHDEVSVGQGWNAAAALWNGARNLGWFVTDNLLSHRPATKPMLDTIGLYALSVGTLLAQKQTQVALKESEALYRLLAENISDLIMRSTRTGECLYISPSVQTLLGYTPEELIGVQMLSLTHPDDETVVRAAYSSALKGYDLISPHQYRAKHKAGHYIWVETVGKSIFREASKEVYEVITSSRDITRRRQSEAALRESEEKYRSLIETMYGGLAVFDAEFRITYVNDRFCELLGYAREEAIGKPLVSFVDTTAIPLVRSHRERRQHGEHTSYEAPLRHKDGHQLSMLLSGAPLLDKQGKHNGSIVVMTDISLQKQAEATLRLALAKEKELGDLKTRFVSMASHEFRTPLTTILALVETLRLYRKKLSEEQIEQRFGKIKAQVELLKNIMEDVLLLARMQAHRVEFKPIESDLDALCLSVLDEFHSQADLKHRLDYTVSEGRHEILLDRKLMRQMISNLVSNAIKYSPEGTVVRIHLEYTDAAVALQVSDEGIGIPEADLPHLFEPFHRAANVGNISGTGLGLVITREAVELHGGTITVESQQGGGTTFLIRIPIASGGEEKNEEELRGEGGNGRPIRYP